MERIIGIEHRLDHVRDERTRAELLRHRRAAKERCVRTGLLRRCAPSSPDGN